MTEATHRTLYVVRGISAPDRTADFVASSDATDSYGEVVKQRWRLDRFLVNPIVLYNHMRSGDALPIGTAAVAIAGGKLECRIKFASEDANPLAEKVWRLVQERVLRAVSVGFRPGLTTLETRNGEEVIVLDDNELYEISVTPIGANPEALAKIRSAGLSMEAPARKTNSRALAAMLDDDAPTRAELDDALVELGMAPAPARAPSEEDADVLDLLEGVA